MECARFMAAFDDGVKSVRVVKMTSWAVVDAEVKRSGSLTDVGWRGHGNKARRGREAAIRLDGLGRSVSPFLVLEEEERLGRS